MYPPPLSLACLYPTVTTSFCHLKASNLSLFFKKFFCFFYHYSNRWNSMFDLVENWQFRSGMKVHFNSSQVQRSHIMWGWPLKTAFQKKPKKKNPLWNWKKRPHFFPMMARYAFKRICAKELGFGNQLLVMRMPPAGGLFRPLRPASFFLSHAKHVEN